MGVGVVVWGCEEGQTKHKTAKGKERKEQIVGLRQDKEAKWNWLQWDTVTWFTGYSATNGAIGLVIAEQNCKMEP